MRMLIDILPPVPDEIGFSYGNFGFAKFGVCCWVYDGYDGAIEWINTKHFCTEPKYAGVSAFRYWFQKNVFATVTPQIQISTNTSDMTVGGVPFNLITGKNMKLIETVM